VIETKALHLSGFLPPSQSTKSVHERAAARTVHRFHFPTLPLNTGMNGNGFKGWSAHAFHYKSLKFQHQKTEHSIKA
jgi:hypothetical protein